MCFFPILVTLVVQQSTTDLLGKEVMFIVLLVCLYTPMAEVIDNHLLRESRISSYVTEHVVVIVSPLRRSVVCLFAFLSVCMSVMLAALLKGYTNILR